MKPALQSIQPINQTLSPEKEYLALLEVTRALASHSTLPDLLQELRHRLRSVLNFNYLCVLLYEPAENKMRLHTLESNRSNEASAPIPSGALYSMEESPSAHVWQTQRPMIVGDVTKEGEYPRVMQLLLDHGVNSFCTLPLTTARRQLGTLTIGSAAQNAYHSEHLDLPLLVATQVAIALENSINYQEAQAAQQQAVRERDRLRLLLEVNNAVVSDLSVNDLCHSIPKSVRTAMQCHAACLSLFDENSEQLRIQGFDFPSSRGFIREQMIISLEGSTSGKAFRSGEPILYGKSPHIRSDEGIESGCFIPIIRNERKLGVLYLLDRRENFFDSGDVRFLSQLASQLSIALDNALQFREISESRSKLQEEARYLRQELRSERGFGDILGESPAIRRVITQIQTVAPTDSTVFITGETGTGKELVARAIHNLSGRRDHSFIKVNCAAIPLGLLESELFGHERGAFTGAIAQKIGRFELAHQGTLFLDEIGDIPQELQPKLLRVIQEQEFERLGSNRTTRVNVRLLAATNRDLARMVEERQFRADLYYRLNVFPISVAPLRERRGDIPLLIHHFVAKFAQRMSKRIEHIPGEVIDALTSYSWPGNIRELQNFIERAVILTENRVLNAPLGELRGISTVENDAASWNLPTLDEAEREHILRVLEQTYWVIAGPSGAAARLGIPRTTLLYRMKRLNIRRRDSQ
ncbi:MAG TPA: sigma 54-interacting transcriptional regulator [Terriglobales bacterium]